MLNTKKRFYLPDDIIYNFEVMMGMNPHKLYSGFQV